MKINVLISFFLLQCLLMVTVSAAEPVAAASAPAEITVYRDPNCSCCHRWIQHLRDNGFKVEDRQTGKLSLLKRELGVPAQLASCHTATVDGYIIEGHVPADDIHRLLTERPDIHGLSVPGMPVGSPGMEMGERRDAYSVIQMGEQEQTEIYQHYPAK